MFGKKEYPKAGIAWRRLKLVPLDQDNVLILDSSRNGSPSPKIRNPDSHDLRGPVLFEQLSSIQGGLKCGAHSRPFSSSKVRPKFLPFHCLVGVWGQRPQCDGFLDQDVGAAEEVCKPANV